MRATRKKMKRIQNAGGVNSLKFWKVFKPNKDKTQKKTSMKDEQGEVKEDTKSIKEIYKTWYAKLLTTTQATSEEQKQAKEWVENCFERLKEEAERVEAEEITKEELEKAIQNLKTKKASDFNNMKNELIKYEGGKLKSSLLILLNEY